MGLAIPKRAIETIQEHQLGMVALSSQQLTSDGWQAGPRARAAWEVLQMQIDWPAQNSMTM
jgi:hypothetical protein